MISEKRKLHLKRLADSQRGISRPSWGHHSEESKRRLSEERFGEKNPNWRGDKVGRIALHEWVGNRIPKPSFCMDCKKEPPRDLANISQKYLRDLSDWEWLCRRCHMKKDGRLVRFKKLAVEKPWLEDWRKTWFCERCKKSGNPSHQSQRFCSKVCSAKTNGEKRRIHPEEKKRRQIIRVKAYQERNQERIKAYRRIQWQLQKERRKVNG